MRVLIVSQYFWPETFRINDLAVSLVADKGHEVTVLTGMPNYPTGKFFKGYGFWRPRREKYCGVHVVRVPLIPRGSSSLMLALNYVSFAISACILGPIYCHGSYDVVFAAQYSPVTVGLPAILMKKLKRAPLFFWIQDLWPESVAAAGAVRSKMIIDMISVLVRAIYRRCDRILVQSRAFVPQVLQRLGSQKRIDYLPNWAEDIYVPADTSMTESIETEGNPNKEESLLVMFAGNIGVAQDFGTILAAAERLKTYSAIRWLIVGDGRMKPWVESEVERRGLGASVALLGRFPIDRMPQFFAMADVMLVTLKQDAVLSLTVPSKIPSYLACAKPILAVLDGEGRRVVEEAGAGIVCPPEDEQALAQAVLTMFHMSRMERETMGRQGLRYYMENFDRRKQIDRLDEWFYEERGENHCVKY